MMNDAADSKKIILIVDDHPANLAILSDYLDKRGFEVWVATDGYSAIQKVEYAMPDLILLDILMPRMNGFEACRFFKSNPKTKELPIIFMSALSETVDKVKGLSLGAVDYITKPFQEEEVVMRVKLHLKLRCLARKLQEKNALLREFNSQLEHRVQEQNLELKSALQELQKAYLDLLCKEEKLSYDATHDPLTGFHNRAWFIQRLNEIIEGQKIQNNSWYAVLFIDLDRFKVINDSLGHLAGDQLLKAVAHRMQGCLSHQDSVARLGGDEFIVLLEGITETSQAIQVAEQIIQQLKQPFQFDNYEVFTGASIGITVSTMGYHNAIDVLRDADVAMYQAKLQGRGCYQVLTPAMQIKAAERLQLEHDLRRAIECREFCLYYQPILSLSTGHLFGFEALIRWCHPERGIIAPSVFIPIAEEIGVINILGWWVLQEACRQIKVWRQQFPLLLELTMNVNVSPLQLKQANLVEKVTEILETTGVLSSWLKLEITESCLLETSYSEVEKLMHLKTLGMKICIDDFGTGYSSLSRLHEFPIDTLKIDRSFVSRLGVGGKGQEIVETIVHLAQRFGMEVVAEGLETPEQLEKLRVLGCELGQGYLFSPPVDSQAAIQFLHNAENLFPEKWPGEKIGRDFSPLTRGKVHQLDIS